MEFSDFIKVLKKHKLTLIIVPVITVIITYFLVRNQPDSYQSQAKIATGIVDQTQNLVLGSQDLQESKVAQDFSNLMEMLKSQKVLDQLAYKLIIHDLTSNDPYRKPSALVNSLNDAAKKHAVEVYTDLYKKRQPLSLFNADQNGLNKVLKSMKYDNESIMRTLTIYRVQNSDYVDVQFESETSTLSAMVVNTICTEFITYYNFLVKENQRKAVNFLGALLQAKQDTLNARIGALKNYKIKNHVLNLNEKAKSLYGQMADFETRREEVEKDTHATQAAINSINKQFDPSARQYAESDKVLETQQYLAAQAQLQTLNNDYVQSNFDPRYASKIDSLKNAVSAHLGALSDKYVLNPLVAKKDLVDQKVSLQVQNELAKNSGKAVDKELVRLNTKFDNLVPHEAATQSLESRVTIASQEYLEILQKYNLVNMESSFSTALRVIESAEPGAPQPSKKMLLVIISGIVSFVFCIVVLFILFFFDRSIKTPKELANETKIPVLGYVNLLTSKSIDLRDTWLTNHAADELKRFRNLIKSIRFEIDNELNGSKVLLINSLAKGEGKTFIAINMTYAYASINKKVLLIDGNFSSPGITKSTNPKVFLEDVLDNTADNSYLTGNTKIVFMGNKGSDSSLLEFASEQQIKDKLEELKAAFDIIIIEASDLTTLNRSKEWTAFADKVVTVFEAGKTIRTSDKVLIDYLKNQKGKFIGWILNIANHHEAEGGDQ